MTDANRLVLHGSFTSSSSYKPMLFLVLSGLPFSFRIPSGSSVSLSDEIDVDLEHLGVVQDAKNLTTGQRL